MRKRVVYLPRTFAHLKDSEGKACTSRRARWFSPPLPHHRECRTLKTSLFSRKMKTSVGQRDRVVISAAYLPTIWSHLWNKSNIAPPKKILRRKKKLNETTYSCSMNAKDMPEPKKLTNTICSCRSKGLAGLALPRHHREDAERQAHRSERKILRTRSIKMS